MVWDAQNRYASSDAKERLVRLKSAIWVSAYLRRCNGEGAFAAVRRRGAEDAGAIFIKLNRLDGTAELFAPAPQSAFDDARPADRAFSRSFGKDPVPEQKVEDKLAKEARFDPDVWIVEVEDRAGRHFIDNVVA
jgi:hypothetical protein